MRLGAAVVLLVGAIVKNAHGQRVVVEEITVVDGPAVALRLSGALRVHARTLHAPERIYFDLPATLAASVPRALNGMPPLARVRTAQHDQDTVRVVLDLDRPVAFTVDAQGPRVLVRLDAVGTPPPAAIEQPKESAVEPPPAATSDPPAPGSRSRMLFYDYRDFDLPPPPEEERPTGKSLPAGHPPVLDYGLGPLVPPTKE